MFEAPLFGLYAVKGTVRFEYSSFYFTTLF